jgi:hypothetical protein
MMREGLDFQDLVSGCHKQLTEQKAEDYYAEL